ncbi:MAG TPA: STAS-like domain-containing protein [Candidatus Saccharimonadales bacterium]|nr:STAS-like domain-containing protein [Candidatus Saccharimonadales bacterium]
MKTIVVKLQAGAEGFAEDKDAAKMIRVETLLPALEDDKRVILDFSNVKYSTQSFVHALLGEALQRFGEAALSSLEFRRCTPQLKSLVQLVVDYSLGGFRSDSASNDADKPDRAPLLKKEPHGKHASRKSRNKQKRKTPTSSGRR